MRQIIQKPTEGLKEDLSQPRKNYDAEELERLGASLRKRQIHPILARPDGTIIDGHRRYRAAKLAGIETLDVIVTEGALSESEIRNMQIASSVHHAHLTGYEMWQACCELLKLNPGWQLKDLAAYLDMDASNITRIMSVSNCIPMWQHGLEEGDVSISDSYIASTLEPDQQKALFVFKMAGTNRTALEREARKLRKGKLPENANTARVRKIKIPMQGGTTVTISGGVTLDEGAEILKACQKLLFHARNQGYDAKTAQLMWRDIAAKDGAHAKE